MFDLNSFISKNITHRSESMFLDDIRNNDEILTQNIQGADVLVIGGAGSIGSAFIKSILKYSTSSLTVVDINENGLTELTRDLRCTNGIEIPENYVTYPIDYFSPIFEKIFRQRKGFSIVANFSAHKHVRSEKDAFAVEAMIRNNVVNARNLLELMREYPPKHFFCVSTDKAANPVNIMGASKKIMEELIMSYASFFPVTTARFANVAFSNGSLLAGFLERIAKKQPLTAPSDVKRFFVSPEESGHICMLSCLLGKSGDVFFPKLKPETMLSFDSIARSLLTELGYEVLECNSESEALSCCEYLCNGEKKYPVYFSQSDTTGEKTYEEFYTNEELPNMEIYSALGVISHRSEISKSDIDKLFSEFYEVFGRKNLSKEEIVDVIKRFIKDFNHEEKGKFLDSKM